VADVKPIAQVLPELREAKGWSRERLSNEAFLIDGVGTSAGMIIGIERGTRRPGLRTMLGLASALGEHPTVFAEYRLALARVALDESRVGLEEALETLENAGLGSIEMTEEEVKRNSHASRLAEAHDRRSPESARVPSGSSKGS
jgi:transcriptional regulator with XRE-family HTH domain